MIKNRTLFFEPDKKFIIRYSPHYTANKPADPVKVNYLFKKR
ncbi:hypothetical protein MuYL_1207 [Mucilaginibacter xinganensis]|uniref:Uncharacterized protein n=1 Tax=Mucilaginibacter xinganensis TaxID=1234841 RepID=A0A223NTC8_9SPHI|nr:hypothetical protein MuYL_1207 [Mucilaginibacter xinganensis]